MYNNKKILIRISSIIAGSILLGLSFLLIDYIYVKEDLISRAIWHKYYLQEENINNILVGSSHVYFDINPQILDEMNDMNNFNISISGMSMKGSYYSILEVLKKHKLDNINLELYYSIHMGVDNTSNSPDTSVVNCTIIDNLKPSLNKLQFIKEMNKDNKIAEAILPVLRFKNDYFNIEIMKDAIKQKNNENYKNYIFEEKSDGYYAKTLDKGYFYITKTMKMEELIFKQDKVLSSDNALNTEAELYLRKIIELAMKEEITINLFVSPIYNLQLISTLNYDEYVNKIMNIADEYEVAFYDFNLVKEEYLDIQHLKYWYDPGHLNGEGATLFTTFFGEVLQNENNEHYFWDTYAEKLENEKARLYGVYSVREDETVRMSIATNQPEKWEFEIIATPTDGEAYYIQKYATNSEFEIPITETGIIQIAGRRIEDQEVIQSLEIQY